MLICISRISYLFKTFMLYEGLLLLRSSEECMVYKMIGIHYLRCQMMGISGL